MLEYIYFVKCPGCDDEHFYFFDEAKDFAMSCMSKKPIITQVEVNRNDFGECTDSTDLGTIWSWEEMMKTDDEPAKCIFTKDDLECTDCNSEFDALDNSLDSVPDNFRKPVPTDMAIEDLVEEMEENEDTVECKWCDELFDKSECRYEVDMGWLCDRCQQAIKSRGETLTFREGPLEEAFKPDDIVEFTYDGLKVTLQGPKRTEDDWDETEETVSYIVTKRKVDVATDIWENFITEEDAKDVDGGLETLEDDRTWYAFLETHWDDLMDKYYDKLLVYYRDDAIKEYEETHSLGESKKAFLEELEEATDYRKRLVDCPECGVAESFDHETGICINCGFNI